MSKRSAREPAQSERVLPSAAGETEVSNGKELWDAAVEHGAKGGVRSIHAMRFYALAKMLAEAETAWLTDNDAQSIERLRQLQAHCEKMISELAPNASVKPTLVVSAA